MNGDYQDTRATRPAVADAALAVAVFVAVFTYVALIPPFIGVSDEANVLHIAKRIADGEVLYRDVFDLFTPSWHYLIALVYRVFGTDIAAVKALAAFIHGLTALSLFLACRAAGVRRGLSWPVPLFYVLLCIPAFPFASQHWLAGLLNTLLLLLCLTRPRTRERWALWPGVIVGLLISVHQRGAIMGAAFAVWLVVDAWLSAVATRRGPVARAGAELGWFAAGVLSVLIPLAIALLATAGLEPVWRALIVQPLVNYRGAVRCSWGHTPPLGRLPQGFPIALKYVPLALIVPALRLAIGAARVQGSEETSKLLALIAIGAGGTASILYFPDYIHIAFIAPLLFVTAAESVEWGVHRLRVSPRVWHHSARVAAVILLVGSGWLLYRSLVAWRTEFSVRAESAFGRVAMSPAELMLFDELMDVLRDAPSRSLFGYPVSASRFCLMADARNPTRYAFFRQGYNSPDQVEELLASLAAHPPAFVVRSVFELYFHRKNDRVAAFIERHYEPVDPKHPIRNLILKPRENTE